MTFLEIIVIIIIHWLADFVIQTGKEAENKSTNNRALTSHVFTYSLTWFIIGTILSILLELVFNYRINYWNVLIFTIITFICHWLTDYFTSRLNTYLWKKGNVHNFFVSVGFDQVLHYIQLFGLYLILK